MSPMAMAMVTTQITFPSLHTRDVDLAGQTLSQELGRMAGGAEALDTMALQPGANIWGGGDRFPGKAGLSGE